MTKNEERYKQFCHDLADITRDWIKEGEKSEPIYPEFRPGFRGYVARALREKGYFKVSIKLGDVGIIK